MNITMKKFLCAILLITASASGDDVVKRGAPIPPDAKRVPLANVLAKPSDFAKQTIVTEGVVETVCRWAGYWMKVAPEAGKAGIRVTFKDGAFVVPRNSGGRNVRLLGSVKLAENNMSFVATGVELANSSR